MHAPFGLRPIGFVASGYHERAHTPIQPSVNADEHAYVDLDPAYEEALHGLSAFSHLWLLSWLGPDQAELPEPAQLRQTPYLLGGSEATYGIFATRGPRRPNPIGLHLVRLVAVSTGSVRITFSGVDMLDGTPIIDIKPWVHHFDQPFGTEPVCGWFAELEIPAGATPESLRQGRKTEPDK